MMAGFMALDGWHDYTCRDKLHHAFWEEFSSACTEYGDSSIRWREAHKVAQLAAKLEQFTMHSNAAQLVTLPDK